MESEAKKTKTKDPARLSLSCRFSVTGQELGEGGAVVTYTLQALSDHVSHSQFLSWNENNWAFTTGFWFRDCGSQTIQIRILPFSLLFNSSPSYFLEQFMIDEKVITVSYSKMHFPKILRVDLIGLGICVKTLNMYIWMMNCLSLEWTPCKIQE